MFKKGTVDQIPRRERKQDFKFANAREWHQLKKGIDAGLNPASRNKPADAVWITLTEDDLAALGIKNSLTVSRFVQKYLTDNSLPYKVKRGRRAGITTVAVHA